LIRDGVRVSRRVLSARGIPPLEQCAARVPAEYSLRKRQYVAPLPGAMHASYCPRSFAFFPVASSVSCASAERNGGGAHVVGSALLPLHISTNTRVAHRAPCAKDTARILGEEVPGLEASQQQVLHRQPKVFRYPASNSRGADIVLAICLGRDRRRGMRRVVPKPESLASLLFNQKTSAADAGLGLNLWQRLHDSAMSSPIRGCPCVFHLLDCFTGCHFGLPQRP